ncbi:MAG: 50S ribosomal protein L29 [Legionellales bacterium RIFCSPHIGHO2_12_FULL_37_14]|nr:MAG: 50S ribosomal protein L29 [Legionellales bacterium RIFCSPHIGHO2_12_FULL_37_14]
MKASELRELSIEELEAKILELRKEMFKLRLRRLSGSLDKFHIIGQTRRLIARVKTIITQKAKKEVANG